MAQTPDKDFFDRADKHIFLSNDQVKECSPGEVSASMMYATARFNAWLTASGYASADQMRANKDKNIQYFMDEYRQMLEINFNQYIENMDSYLGRKK